VCFLHPTWTAGQVREKNWRCAPTCIGHPHCRI
jgi:hypothetical protein